MIRDRIVVGIRNLPLAEKLQLDTDLTLSKAVTLVHQTEAVKQQQPLLRGEGQGAGAKKPDTHVGAVLGRRSGQGKASGLNKDLRSLEQLPTSRLQRLHAADVASRHHTTTNSSQPAMQCVINVPSEDTFSLFVDPLPRLEKCTRIVSKQALVKHS